MRQPSSKAIIAVVVAVAVIGGGAFLYTGSSPSDDGQGTSQGQGTDSTSTTVASHEVSQEIHPEKLPAGLQYEAANDSVTIDESTIKSEHLGKLQSSSFTAAVNRPETEHESQLVRKVGSNGAVLFKTDSTARYYAANTNEAYQRVEGPNNETHYLTSSGVKPPRKFLGGFSVVKKSIEGFTFSYEKKTRFKGDIVYKLSITNASHLDRTAGRFGVSNATDVSGYLYVDRENVIRKAKVTFTSTVNGEQKTSTMELTVWNVGKTLQSPPEWVSTAKKTAVRMDVSKQESAIALKKTDGQTIPKETDVFVKTKNGEYRANLTESVENGETIYAAVTKDGDLKVTVGEPVSGSVSGENYRSVFIAEDSLYYKKTFFVAH